MNHGNFEDHTVIPLQWAHVAPGESSVHLQLVPVYVLNLGRTAINWGEILPTEVIHVCITLLATSICMLDS